MTNPENPTFETVVPADVMQTLDEIRAAEILAQQSEVAKSAEDIIASIEDPEARENAENLMKDFGSVPVKTEVTPVDPFAEPPKGDPIPLSPSLTKASTPAPKIVPPAPKATKPNSSSQKPKSTTPSPSPTVATPRTETTPSNVIDITDRLIAQAANSYRVRRINNREARQSKSEAREQLKSRDQKIESNVRVTKAQEAFNEAEQNMQRAKEALSRDARRERALGIYNTRIDTLRNHFTKDGVLDEKRFGASLKGLERASKKAAKVQARAEFTSSKRIYETRATTLGSAEKNRREEIKSMRWFRNTRFHSANRQGIRYNGYVKAETSGSSTDTVSDITKAREAAAKKRRDEQNARTKAQHATAKNKPTAKPQVKTPAKKAA